VDNIIALATKQAETVAVETRQSLRIKLAEDRIAGAEREAVRELRNSISDQAKDVASRIIEKRRHLVDAWTTRGVNVGRSSFFVPRGAQS
jgi:hypothetical protein